MIRRRLALMLLAAVSLPVAAATPAPPSDPYPPAIQVDIQGDTIRVGVHLRIAAPLDTVWATLTDVESMPRYISNLHESRVLERSEHRLRVFQKGAASFGPITFPFEMEREITLMPKEKIDVIQLHGNLKRYRGITLLHAEGEETQLDYQSEAATDAFIPPVLGRRFIENETQEQYAELEAEVRRRHAVHHAEKSHATATLPHGAAPSKP